eukprot:CAMPEP_0118926996 /NCGR_PEP_ID=MMETSP1169-20130426/4577_1 /TAXON_ID=36882 /ORGANISM="Pyramimonas obovata, Strain CCMP722" /LENGTH=195 /DNA_ID=CAMNT_0006868671 /DNA_START=58 /DNA_END=642 /DNA_ORIENTATION=-
MACASGALSTVGGESVGALLPAYVRAEHEHVPSASPPRLEGANATCPQGHSMSAKPTPHANCSCDGCDQGLAEGTLRMTCGECDYDLCKECLPISAQPAMAAAAVSSKDRASKGTAEAFAVGDEVCVKASVSEPRGAGWNGVKHEDVGTVTAVDGTSLKVDFPNCSDWWFGHADDMENVTLMKQREQQQQQQQQQ